MKKPEEFEEITTSKDIDRKGEHIPEGSTGTVVHDYDNGKAYEVEFDECRVVTVYISEIKL